MAAAITSVFTIGHSNHPIDAFITLLRQHGITALADVRSAPYSRFQPQFNKDALDRSLKAEGIKYVFLGKELGARSEDRSCYQNGRVRYPLLAETALFRNGLERVMTGAQNFKIAIMCALGAVWGMASSGHACGQAMSTLPTIACLSYKPSSGRRVRSAATSTCAWMPALSRVRFWMR
jgi:hypothetical protein